MAVSQIFVASRASIEIDLLSSMKGCTWIAVIVDVLYGLVTSPTLAVPVFIETSEAQTFKYAVRFVLFVEIDSDPAAHRNNLLYL